MYNAAIRHSVAVSHLLAAIILDFGNLQTLYQGQKTS